MPPDSPLDEQDAGRLSENVVYEEMEPFVPYTTEELANRIGTSLGETWSVLRRLAKEEKIQKKEPEPNLRIWVLEPPENACSNCDYEFQVKFLHPALSSVRYCPNCGTQMSDSL